MPIPRAFLGFALALSTMGPALASTVADKLEGIYRRSFGSPRDPALVFVHGGPGYHSRDFEATLAPRLAAAGFFVLVYDQRGQGRSAPAPEGDYRYARYADDLAALLDEAGLPRATLLGHSHGGAIALHFLERHPERVEKIILVAAPVVFEDSLRAIHELCARRFEAAGQGEKARVVAALHAQLFRGLADTHEARVSAVAMSFAAAGECGVYAGRPSEEGRSIWRDYLAQARPDAPDSGRLTAMPGFLSNEDYIRFDGLALVHRERARIAGIYGELDGLFTPLARNVLANALSMPGEPERLRVIPDASHAVYMDQPAAFVEALRAFTGATR